MTEMKIKLQIMREKKGLTVNQLAKKVCPVGTLRFGGSDYRHVMIAIAFHEQGYQSGISALWDDIAQALGCSVEELVED